MALKWTTPKTFRPDERLRAADLNAYLRDNLKYLHDRPRCAVQRTADLQVWPSQDTAVRWTRAAWDTHNMWDPGVPARVRLPVSGIYHINVRVLWDEDDVGARHIRLRDHNGTVRAGDRRGAVSPTEATLDLESNFTAGDWIEADVRQTAATSVTLRAIPSRSPIMTVRFVSAGPGL